MAQMAYIPQKLPGFRYTGAYETRMDAAWGWYIVLLEDGELTFTDYGHRIDVCLIGGGAGGESRNHTAVSAGGDGGGGGEVISCIGVEVRRAQDYAVRIGAGGAADTGGGKTTAFGFEAAGGTANAGGAGGSRGGEMGEDGQDGSYPFGIETLGRMGADGGGGGGAPVSGGTGGRDGGGSGGKGGGPGYDGSPGGAGTDRTGAGGGGGGGGETWETESGATHEQMGGAGGMGGSGAVILRNSEDDVLPVFFNGTQLQAIYLNGRPADRLIYDGEKLY